MPKIARLSSTSLRNSASRLLPQLGIQDQRRLESIVKLFGEANELALSRVLKALFADKTPEDQLTSLRLFRSRLAAAAEDGGCRLTLAVDSRKRSEPEQRRCWFEGEDIAEVEVAKLTLSQEAVQPLVPQRGVELDDGKEVLFYFVMWSAAAEPRRLGADLLQRLQAHFDSCKRFKFRPWSCENINVGASWHAQIQKAIQKCDFGLLLLGPEFFASRYISEYELPHFVVSDEPDQEGRRIAIPVALKAFLRDGARVDLRGLEHRQIFFRQRRQGVAAAFEQERSAADKSEFVLRLFERILARFETVPRRSRWLEAVPAPKSARADRGHAVTQGAKRALKTSTGETTLGSPEEAIMRHAIPVPRADELVVPEGIAGALDRMESTGGAESGARRLAAFEYLNDWLAESGGAHYCALLGELGIGKTTTCREWARQLIQRRRADSDVPLPIYFDLRGLATEVAVRIGRTATLEEYLEVLIRKTWQGGELRPAITPQDIVDLVQTRGAVILYDGLDEILVHKTHIEGQAFVRELLRILPPLLLEAAQSRDGLPRRGRVLISCRTHYFRTLRDQTNFMLGEHREPLRSQHYRAFLLLPFSDAQIEQYLSQLRSAEDAGHADVDRYLELIESVHNLKDCARRPLLLRLIAEQLPVLEQCRARGEPVDGATLYDGFVRSWLERDEGKHKILPEHKQRIMECLAAELWRSGRRGLSVEELENWLLEFVDAHPKIRLHYPQMPLEILKEDLRTATFLVRGSEDTFQFAHTSLQEFFLALYLRRGLLERDWQTWETLRPSIETLTFVGQLLQVCPALLREQALASLRSLRDHSRGEQSVLAFRYGLHALQRGFPSPALAGFHLEGADLRNLQVRGDPKAPRLTLNGVSWVGARLENAIFSRVSLEKADFGKAALDLTEFHDCRLMEASFIEARMSGTVFRDCDMRDACFEEARCYSSQWMRCQLAGAKALPTSPAQAHFAACASAPASAAVSIPLGFEVFDGHWAGVDGVCFSPDGRYVASGSIDHTLKLWEVASGECLRTFVGHEGRVTSVTFSPDGLYIVSGSDDRTLGLWEVRNGERVRRLAGHEGTVSSVAFSPNGRYVLSGSHDRTLKLWDLVSGECARSFAGHEFPVSSVAFSPDGFYVISCGRTLKLWEVTTGECLRQLADHEGAAGGVAFSPDGRYVVSGSDDYTLKLWEVAGGECVRRFAGHEGPVSSVAFSPDGRYVVSGSNDHTLKLWEVAGGECLRIFSGHYFLVRSVAFSANGRYVVSGSSDKTIKVWEAASGECLRSFAGHNVWVSDVAVSPDGNYLASVAHNCPLQLWRLDSGECVRSFAGAEVPMSNIVFSPDGRYLVAGSYNNTLTLWEVTSGEHLRTFAGHDDSVNCVAFSPDGRYVVSGSFDETLKLWEVISGECVRSFVGSRIVVNKVAFSPDGLYVVGGSNDGSVKLWQVAGAECLRTFAGHETPVSSVAFSPDGRYVVSGSSDRTLRLWDVGDGGCLHSFMGHERQVNSVAFSPNGRYVVSGSVDQTVKLWDVVSGECLHSFCGFDGQVNSVAFLPDGESVTVGGPLGLSVFSVKASLDVSVSLRLRLFRGGAWAAWKPGVSKVPRWSGDAWRWLGWQVHDPRTGYIDRYPIEMFDAALKRAAFQNEHPRNGADAPDYGEKLG